jgi:plastocyanin
MHRLLVLAVSVLIIFSSCKKEEPGDPGPNEVWLEYQLFRPSQLEITTGTTIRFINKGNPNHQLQGSLFSTGTLQTDDEYSHTFTTPGTYYFTCGIHGNVSSEQVAIRVQ